jgi:predicted nucleic acid-binding protein
MIVVDASIVLDLLLVTNRSRAIRARLATERLLAPHLLDIEVAQVLRRYERTKVLTARRGEEALQDLAALPVARYPHTALLPRIWQLRQNLTGYDAAYVALAEMFEVPLLTTDEKMAAAPGHRATIELI